MLSYRHAFHAGNYADVLKHLVLVKTISYLLKKDSPILYIDTHAGAGLYQTSSPESLKTGEFSQGYGQLDFNKLLQEHAATYQQLVSPYREQDQYPGSPLIAMNMLRAQDQLRLFELHPTDFSLLSGLSRRHKRCKVEQSDGFQSLKALLPVQQRALVLIDPSYEIKTDYDDVVTSVVKAYERMPTAIFLIWYPVVNRHTINDMIKQLRKSSVRDLWQFELGIAQDDNQSHGMTSSGIFAINPPWTLATELQSCLPEIQQQIAKKHGLHLVQRLIDE